MSPITTTSSSLASQIYSGVQRTNTPSAKSLEPKTAKQDSGFKLPSNATPRGDWVLAENSDPQSFEQASPRGTYLNVVV